ncbi:MAG: AI-2E family transporter [Gammaproteobacteria bacterium]
MDHPDHERQLRLATAVAIRLGVLALLIGWCAVIRFPFLLPIAWGAIIAVALHGPYRMLRARLGGRRALAAACLVLVMLATILAPALLIGGSIAQEAQVLVDAWLAGELSIPRPSARVAEWPLVGDRIHEYWTLAAENTREALARLAPHLGDVGPWLLGAVAGFGMALLQAVFAIVLSGVMLATARDGASTARAVAVRLGGERGEALLELATAAIRGVTRGIVGVALIQSLLAGFGLLVAGVPAAGLLTVLMLVLCIVQLGPGLVMVPAAIWLFANAATGVALAFTVWTVLLMPVDNILKPLLMGRGVDVPLLVIFPGAIGGFLTQGIIGLFVGAVVLALGYQLGKEWLHDAPARADAPD